MSGDLGSLVDAGGPPVTGSEVAERVELVRAQLAPIRSRTALLDSYARESLNRLAAGYEPGSEGQVIDLAYALRWFELGNEPCSAAAPSRPVGSPSNGTPGRG